jgi:hypothetical protein
MEIQQRTLMANRTSYGLKKQLTSRYFGMQTKCAIYKTCTYLWVIPCEVIQTIFKKIYILYTYFYILSYFKNIF